MLIFCKILKTLSSKYTNMKNSKWSSKIKLKLKVPRKSVEPRRKLFSAKVMDSRKKVRGKRTRRVLRTIREESRKRFTRFAASAERNLISRCWKWWFPEVSGRFWWIFENLIKNWFLNIEYMILNQFFMLNSILESISIDSNKKILIFTKFNFFIKNHVKNYKDWPGTPSPDIVRLWN